jgi:hypothetical protein
LYSFSRPGNNRSRSGGGCSRQCLGDGLLVGLRSGAQVSKCGSNRRRCTTERLRYAASAKGTTEASQKKGAPKAKTGAKTAPTSRKEARREARKQEARDGSKKGAEIELPRRKEGVTAAEIVKRTNC